MPPPTEGVIAVDNCGQLIANALQDGGIVGIDEEIEQIVFNKAFRHTNWLIDEWSRHRWLIYSLTELSVVSTGALTYTIGAGQPFNISPRPDRLEYAFLRFLNNPPPAGALVDIPLDIIASREDYSRITVKQIGTLPWRVFYDTQWPIGILNFWPIPQASLYEMHIGIKTVLPRFQSPNQPINFPPEYENALNWNLARRFRTAFQMPPDPEITQLARTSLNAMRLANQQVGTLVMPAFLRNRQRAYDYRGDNAGSW